MAQEAGSSPSVLLVLPGSAGMETGSGRSCHNQERVGKTLRQARGGLQWIEINQRAPPTAPRSGEVPVAATVGFVCLSPIGPLEPPRMLAASPSPLDFPHHCLAVCNRPLRDRLTFHTGLPYQGYCRQLSSLITRPSIAFLTTSSTQTGESPFVSRPFMATSPSRLLISTALVP